MNTGNGSIYDKLEPQKEEQKKAEHSPEYEAFLRAVEKNGAYVVVFKDGKQQNWNVKKGSKNHGVTDDDLVSFKPLTRKQQREIFHTPYKFGRRIQKPA